MVLNRKFSIFAISGVILTFTVFAGCVSAGPTVSYYRPTAQNQEILSVDEWIEKGDAFYFKDDYDNAKECYFRALIGDSTRIDVLNSYGVTLVNTGFYENALVIFNIASKIDPSDETVQYNISFCRQQIAMRTEQQRQLQLQAQQQQQENFNNLIASMNALASSIQQQQQSQSGGYASGGNTGRQGSRTSSGEDRHIANNPASAERTYHNYAIAAKNMYNNLDNAKRTDSSSPTQSHKDRIRELEKSLKDTQKKMNDLRLEAKRQGVDIREDPYESKQPR